MVNATCHDQPRTGAAAVLAALDAVWHKAHDAVTAIEEGRASFASLASALDDIAEASAAGLNDLPAPVVLAFPADPDLDPAS